MPSIRGGPNLILVLVPCPGYNLLCGPIWSYVVLCGLCGPISKSFGVANEWNQSMAPNSKIELETQITAGRKRLATHAETSR